MEKFFNDIQTFIAQMDSLLKLVIVVLLTVIDLLIIRSFVKSTNKDKRPKIKIVNLLLFLICSGLLVLIAVYSF